jgi:y4mF family transcriptional regulator
MNSKEAGDVIKERRKFLRISQKDLADIVGVGLRSLVDIENGKGNPTVSQLNKILEALGLKLEINVK